MFPVVAALALTPIAYGFAPGSTSTYHVRVGLKGYLPILGGKEGQGQIDMAVKVDGLSGPASGKVKASSDLTEFVVKMNGAQLPFTLETAKGFFPKNTVVFTPQGKVEENDASESQLPVRLPGLDPKRFPDITYLPIEFPSDGIEEGKSWSFKKVFDTLDLNYTVTPVKLSEDSVDLKIHLTAHDEFLEDSAHVRTSTDDDAAFKVTSELTGGGTAKFNRKKNLVEAVEIKMTIDTKVVDKKTNETTPRKLEISLDVSQGKELPSALLARSGSGPLDLLRDKIQQSRPVQSALVAAQLMHPSSGNGRKAAAPFIRSAVNNIHIPSKRAIQGQWQNLTVLASDTARRVPELLDVHAVQPARNFLSGIPSVFGLHWGPYHEGAERLADQVIEYVSPNNASAYKAPGVRRSKNQHKPSLPASHVKARR